MAFTVLLALATLVSGLQAVDFNKDIDYMLQQMKRVFPDTTDLPDHNKILPFGLANFKLKHGELRGINQAIRQGNVVELGSPTPGVRMIEVDLLFGPLKGYYDFDVIIAFFNFLPTKVILGDGYSSDIYANIRVGYVYVENRSTYRITKIDILKISDFTIPIQGSFADIPIVVNNLIDIFNTWIVEEAKKKLTAYIETASEQYLSD